MSVVAVTSSRTSPGATTLATGLAIAWSYEVERSLLIEADPAGGVLGLRFDLAPSPSLTSLGSAIENGFHNSHVWASTQDLRGVRCIPAPVDPLLSRTCIDWITPALVERLPLLGAPTVVDLGWVDHGGASAALASAADTTLIVSRPDVAEIQALLFQVRRLQAMNTTVKLVTIGDSPHDPREIAQLAGVPLAAVLPEDRRFASALAGGEFKPERFRRSSLWRTISGLASTLLDEQLMRDRVLVEAPLNVVPPPSFDEMRGPLDEISPAALRSNTPLPTAQAGLRGPQSDALISALAIPPPLLPPRPSAESVARVLATAPQPVPTPTLQPAPSPSPTIIDLAGAAEVPALPPSYPLTVANDPGLHEVTRRMHHTTTEPDALLILPTGIRLPLHNQTFTIGRHSECDIKLNDSHVSRRHGRLMRTDQGWHYVDLGSRNGTELNNHPCTTAVLCTGDTLMIGRSVVTFEDAPESQLVFA